MLSNFHFHRGSIFILIFLIIFSIVGLIINQQMREKPNSCIIETKNEKIIGKNCWKCKEGCIHYLKEEIKYELCGDFKINYIKEK